MYKFPEETLKALRENRMETLDLGALGFKGKATLSGHTDSVYSLALLPDGRLASGSQDRTIRLWNVRSEKCEATLSGHGKRGWSLAVLPDGRLASGSDDWTIRLWNVESGKCESTLSGYCGPVHSLALLPDGRLASGSSLEIRLWNVRSGICEATLSRYEDRLFSLATLPDGLLASGSEDKTIRLWNVRSGKCEAILSGHENRVLSLTVLSDGRLASGSDDWTIRLWNVRSEICEATLSGHERGVTSLAMLPDGRLASGSWDNTIRLWNVRSGVCEAILSYDNYVYSLAVLPDGRLAAGECPKLGVTEAYIRLWPIAPDKTLFLDLKSALESNNTLKKIEWSGCESLFNEEEHAWLKTLLERNLASKIAVSTLPPTPKVIAAPEVTKPAAGGAGASAEDTSMMAEIEKLKAQLAAKELEEKSRIAELEEKERQLAVLKAKPTVASIFTIIPSKDLIFSEKLGEGSFGAVYKGKWNEKNVALKKLVVEVLSKEEEAEFKGEALVQAGLHHENIVELIGICLERAKYTLVMELMPKGSLYAVLKNGDLPWSVKL